METTHLNLTKSQRLQKQINELLFPDKIDRLKKGCQIICQYNGLITLTQDAERHKETEFYYCYGFDDNVGVSRSCKGNELLEVLGKPIEFTDLCLFFSNIDNTQIVNSLFYNNTGLFEITIELHNSTFFDLTWDCSKNFHDQEDDFYDLFKNLINQNI